MTPQVDKETGLEIDSCPECYGLWFDGHELSRFLAGGTLRRKFEAVAEVQPLDSIGFTLSTKQRKCPRCRQPLEERMFADVTLDVCGQCEGIWLDDGELQRILRKYEKGAQGDDTVRKELDRGYGREGRSAGFLGTVLGFFRKSAS